ncbi:Cysteine-rich transmembrane CYSTM domain [Arabidopsis suecica]|uniref:Cysteine-rich transmembrane CYSTM domain n=1 Tax=Arabidopsis suecica TaxID=45249 RepID=A0A8T2AIF5_ARASU|nr:Cysteine-rich transmembrane CYSTM domain [Arabidopsis suecica]
MNQFSQNQSSGAYPSPPVSTGPYVAPPPLGYPTNDTSHAPVAPVETKSKGDGFLKGWLVSPSFGIFQLKF